jgi:hypothetical protein
VSRNAFISLSETWTTYYNFKQGPEKPRHDYHKDFQSLVEVLEHYGGVFGAEKPFQDAVEKVALSGKYAALKSDEDKLARVVSVAKDKAIAIQFMKNADPK